MVPEWKDHHVSDWTFFADPDEHRLIRHRSAQRFTAHARTSPQHYVPAALPTLPFPDGSFDLVLSSHLLFSYADDLDYDFHRRSILELARVTRSEIQLFPLMPVGSAHRYPQLDELLAELARSGVTSRIVQVDYEFQRGGNEMVVCRV
ncbi:methyltransferase domain-containing protein [Nocardia lasii]|uniref:Methyltransferase domain-containing protein n=1 Tax=Nocardia lasii TaxID=1616107 RepID=A0ABW1JLK6_9NOCA